MSSAESKENEKEVETRRQGQLPSRKPREQETKAVTSPAPQPSESLGAAASLPQPPEARVPKVPSAPATPQVKPPLLTPRELTKRAQIETTPPPARALAFAARPPPELASRKLTKEIEVPVANVTRLATGSLAASVIVVRHGLEREILIPGQSLRGLEVPALSPPSVEPRRLEAAVPQPAVGLAPGRPAVVEEAKQVEAVANPANETKAVMPGVAAAQGLTEEGLPAAKLLEELGELVPRPLADIGEMALSRRPLVLILPRPETENSYVLSLGIICGELYRTVKGGRPEPRWISSGLKDEVERYLRAGDMVFIVDDARSGLLPRPGTYRSPEEFVNKVNVSLLADRLRELFLQDFGCIIFHVSDGVEYAHALSDLMEREPTILAKPKVLGTYPVPTEIAMNFVRAAWGFVSVDDREVVFDGLFKEAEDRWHSLLQGVKDDVVVWDEVIRRSAPDNDEEGGQESEEHRLLKALVVEHLLAEKLGIGQPKGPGEAEERTRKVRQALEGGTICIECDLAGGAARVRPDVYYRDSDGSVSVYEVETFYGTGDPYDKLLRTLGKYNDPLGAAPREVNLVIPGLQLLLFARRLARAVEFYRQLFKERGIKVNIYTVDVEARRLVPLSEVIRALKGEEAKR